VTQGAVQLVYGGNGKKNGFRRRAQKVEECFASRYARPMPYWPAFSQTASADWPLLLEPGRQKSKARHNPLKSQWPE
jgi:hypothetical protein